MYSKKLQKFETNIVILCHAQYCFVCLANVPVLSQLLRCCGTWLITLPQTPGNWSGADNLIQWVGLRGKQVGRSGLWVGAAVRRVGLAGPANWSRWPTSHYRNRRRMDRKHKKIK